MKNKVWVAKFIQKDYFEVEIICVSKSKEKVLIKTEDDILQYIADAKREGENLEFPKRECDRDERIFYKLNPSYASVIWDITQEDLYE
jgi:hypothetical protein